MGETENIGNPRTPAEVAYGRSLPYPEIPDFPIRGYEYYDFRHEVDNVTFVNYEDNATRKAGAMSYLMYTSFGISSNNTVQRAKFVNAKPVYFPPMERRWGNDNGGSAGWRTAVFKDKDGSVGGIPNSYILIHDGVNNSIAVDEACEIKPTWNAAVCRGDVGRMTVGGGGGGGFGGGPWRRRTEGRWCRLGAATGPGAVTGRGGGLGAAGAGAPGWSSRRCWWFRWLSA